jgi:protein-tyrosine phosphatase
MSSSLFAKTAKALRLKDSKAIGDYNQIIDGVLWVGAFVRPEDAGQLRRMGITVVVSLQTNADLARCGIPFHRLTAALALANVDLRRMPVRDFDGEDLALKLPKCVAELEAALEPKWAKAYLHCTAGVNRSATVAAGYLIKDCYMPSGIACEYVKSRRECQPDLELLREYEKGLRGM